MTATEVINEIKNLEPREQARVILFVRDLDRTLQRLTGRELTALAEGLAQVTNPAEIEALKARVVAGFYAGGNTHA